MKTAEEFRKEVYEKQSAAVAARHKRNRRSALCVSLALVVMVCGVGVPRLLSQKNNDALRPRLLQVGSPKNPVDLSSDEAVEQEFEDQMKAETLKAEQEIRKLQNQAKFRQEVLDQAAIEPWFSDGVNGLIDAAALNIAAGHENDCISPLSLYYDLALLSSGAEWETAEELRSLLGVDAAKSLSLAEQCRHYYAQHYRSQMDSIFRLENSLWLDSAHTYSDAFIRSAEENFFASLFLVDFSDPTVADDMTNWVAEQTNGLLNPSFEFGKDHKASILNSLYYRNTWAAPFDPAKTETGKFTTSSGVVDAEFMHRTFTTDVYQMRGDWKCFLIPLSDGDEMVIIFPDNSHAEVTMESVFGYSYWLDQYLEWQEYPDIYKTTAMVDLSIPKFTVKQEYDLIDMLPSIARDEVLADFGNMGNVELFVSKLQHDVSFTIDENGVEAASGTEIGLSTTGVAPEETMEINLNRPFAYAVLTNDKTTDPDATKKTVVYYGVCGDPTQN